MRNAPPPKKKAIILLYNFVYIRKICLSLMFIDLSFLNLLNPFISFLAIFGQDINATV